MDNLPTLFAILGGSVLGAATITGGIFYFLIYHTKIGEKETEL